jgi:hypothetical protein
MKKQQIKSAVSAALLGVLSPLAMVLPASAGTATWAGSHPTSGYDGLASTACNWELCDDPNSGDSVVFPTSGINQIVEFDAPHTVGPSSSSLELANLIFSGAWEGTSSKSYELTSDHILNMSGNIEAVMTGNGGDHSVDAPVALQADLSFKTTGANTLSVGGSSRVIDLGANDLTLDALGGTITIMGKLKGSGNITAIGAGKVKLLATPDAAGFTGGLTASTGEIVVDQNLGVNVTLTGGTLKGIGSVGTVTMSSGKVAPGQSPGVLSTGNLTFTGGGHDVELGGTAAGQFDQINVTGTVNLGSATALNIALVNGYAPAVNDSFIIVNNDGTDAVTGTFAGLADGAKSTLGGYTYQINYDAGDGNDITLLVTGTPSAPDTGVGSLISSPFATVFAAVMVGAAVAGYRVFESKKIRK